MFGQINSGVSFLRTNKKTTEADLATDILLVIE